MTARRLMLAVALTLCCTMLVASPAWAFWATSGSGRASATTGTLNPPTAVTVPASSTGSVAVSWTASGGSLAATGYNVQRTNTSTLAVAGACGTPATAITATSCTDAGVPAGSYTYQVTAAYRSWTATSAPSSSTTVAAAAAKLAFTVAPSDALAGAAISPAIAVTVENAAGTAVATAGVPVSLAIATNPGSGTLTGTTSTTTDATGVATFSGLSINKVGAGYTLAATSGSLPGATSSAFAINAAAASRLVFTSAPSGNQTATAATTIGPFVVQVQDAFGNPAATTAVATLTLSSTSSGTRFFTTTSGGTVAAPVTIASGSATSASFYYADSKAGAQTITASGTVNSIPLSSAGTSVTVVAAAASVMTFVSCSLPANNAACIGQPIVMGNNASLTLAISLSDSFGNAARPASTLTIDLSNSDSTFTSGATATVDPLSSTSAQITLHHGVNGGTDTLKAHAAGFTDITLTAKK